MKTIKVDFGEVSYPLFIGNDVLDRFGEILSLYRFPDTVIIILQDGVSAQFIPSSESFSQIELPKSIQSNDFSSIEKFFASIPLEELESGVTLLAVGDDSLLNVVSFGSRLLSHPPVVVNVPTTLWAMAEYGVKYKAFLSWNKQPSVISMATWPQMAMLDLHSLQNTDSNELFLLHANIVRNLLFASMERFAEYEESWQKIKFEDEDSLIDILEQNAKTRIAILKQGSNAQHLLQDFGLRAVNTLKSDSKHNLKKRDIASMIFLELRWRLKLASHLKIGKSESFSRVLFLIEKLLAKYQIKQDEWDMARDMFLQCFSTTMLNNLYLPSSIGKMQKIKVIERVAGEKCLLDC